MEPLSSEVVLQVSSTSLSSSFEQEQDKWDKIVPLLHSNYIFLSFAGENRELARTLAEIATTKFSPVGKLGNEVFFDEESVFAGEYFEKIYLFARKYSSAIMLIDKHFLSKEAPLKELTAFEQVNIPRVFVLLQSKETLFQHFTQLLSSISPHHQLTHTNDKDSLESLLLFNKNRLLSILEPENNNNTNHHNTSNGDNDRIKIMEFPAGLNLNVEELSQIAGECVSLLGRNIRLLLEKMTSNFEDISALSLNPKDWIFLRKKLHRLQLRSEIDLMAERVQQEIRQRDLQNVKQKHEDHLKAMEDLESKFYDLLGDKAPLLISILQNNNISEDSVENFNEMCNQLTTEQTNEMMGLWSQHMQMQFTKSIIRQDLNIMRVLSDVYFYAMGDLNFSGRNDPIRATPTEDESIIGNILVIQLSETEVEIGLSLANRLKDTFQNHVQVKFINNLDDAKQFCTIEMEIQSLDTEIPCVAGIIIGDDHHGSDEMLELLNQMEYYQVQSFPILSREPNTNTFSNNNNNNELLNNLLNRKGIVKDKYKEEEYQLKCLEMFMDIIVIYIMKIVSNDPVMQSFLEYSHVEESAESMHNIVELWSKSVAAKVSALETALSFSHYRESSYMDRLITHAPITSMLIKQFNNVLRQFSKIFEFLAVEHIHRLQLFTHNLIEFRPENNSSEQIMKEEIYKEITELRNHAKELEERKELLSDFSTQLELVTSTLIRFIS